MTSPRVLPFSRTALALVGLALALALAALAAAPADAATRRCPDLKDGPIGGYAFSIRAVNTSCRTARALAHRSRAFVYTAGPWSYRAAGFACRGGHSWAATRSRRGVPIAAQHSEGVGLTYWRCTTKRARVTFIRAVVYGG